MNLDALREAVAKVADPEIPVVTIEDLGILREVRIAPDGITEVVITPTYSGCPATEAIKQDVLAVAHEIHPSTRVVMELAPAWTTDWITAEGRAKLAAYGIAPPLPTRSTKVPMSLGMRSVHCPQCGSGDTEVTSKFGSTPCKALRRCRACLEPFDEFKPL